MKHKAMIFAIAVAGLVSALAMPVHAGTIIFTENFNLAKAGSQVTTQNFSEKWASTYYYLNPAATFWTFNTGALLAVNGPIGVAADKAVLLNESPAHAQAINTNITGLVSGQTYALSFDHWGDNRPGTTYSFTVSIGSLNQSSISRLYQFPGPGTTETLMFQATGSIQTLTFLDTTNVGEGSAIVDNITVQTVPEPTLVLLLGLGLGAACLVAWPRRG